MDDEFVTEINFIFYPSLNIYNRDSQTHIWEQILEILILFSIPGKYTEVNHWPVASHWQTLSHNVVSSTPRLSWIRPHNISGDRHCLHIHFLKYVMYVILNPLPEICFVCYACWIHFLKYFMYVMLNPLPEICFVCYAEIFQKVVSV
jgi:hypothetical protein